MATSRPHVRRFLAGLLALLMLPGVLRAADPPSLADVMPPDAIVFSEVNGLAAVLDRIQHCEGLKMLQAQPAFATLTDLPQYQQSQAVRAVLEKQLGMDLWSAGKQILGKQAAVALYPPSGGAQPETVGIIRVSDPAVLPKLLQSLEPFLVLQGQRVDKSQKIEGIPVTVIGDRVFIASQNDWGVVASNGDLLGSAIRLLTGKAKKALSGDDNFAAFAKQTGTKHLSRTYVNTDALYDAIGRPTPVKLENAFASFVLGGILELAYDSPYAGSTFDLGEEGFTLTAHVAAGPEKLGPHHQVFFSDPDGPGTPPIPHTPSLLGGFTIHRDLAGWYQNREELLDSSVLAGFDQFEAGIGNLLPGRDIGEDVLPLMGSNITFVAAPQDYDHLDGEPGIKFPGLAIIIELAKPQEAADLFQMFFQTLAAILNLQAGQQGRQPWVMTSEDHDGVQIAYARFLKRPSGDRLPYLYNFMPSSSRVGNQFIISSSRGFCRQLVDELQKPVTASRTNKNFNFVLHFDPVADMVQANESFFVARSIQSGATPEEAKEQLASLVKLVRAFDAIKFSTSVEKNVFRVRLEGSWK